MKNKNKTLLNRVSGETILIPKKETQDSWSLTSTENYYSGHDYRNCWHHPIIGLRMKPALEDGQSQRDHKEQKPRALMYCAWSWPYLLYLIT